MARNANTNVRGSAKGLSNNPANKKLVGKNSKHGGATGGRRSTRRVPSV